MVDTARRQATAELLWACAAPFPDRGLIASRSSEPVDDDLLAAAAIEQKAAPLVWRALSAAGVEERIAVDPARRLRAEAARWGAKAHYLPSALERAISPLAAAGLEPLVIKGAALADRYPDPAVRPMGDIDVVLPARAHAAAVAALEREGWSIGLPLTRLRHETTLIHADVPTVTLELHIALERWHDRITRLDSDELWTRRRPATLLGTRAFALAPEDELVLVAAHAGKPFHCFDRLVWFADLAVIIAAASTNGGLDWDAVNRRATTLKASTILGVALRQAARLGADVPPDALPPLPARGWRTAVLETLMTADWPLAAPAETIRHRARYALCETWPRRGLLFLGETPHEPLWRQPFVLANRLRMAVTGLPGLRRAGSR